MNTYITSCFREIDEHEVFLTLPVCLKHVDLFSSSLCHMDIYVVHVEPGQMIVRSIYEKHDISQKQILVDQLLLEILETG